MPGNTNQGFTSRPDGTTGGIDSTDGDSQGSQAVSLINWFMFLIFRSYFSVGKEAEFRFGAFALKFEPI